MSSASCCYNSLAMNAKKVSVVFCDNNLMSSSFQAFEDMRQKGDFTDFKMDFGNRSVSGHRLVLAAAIPYFRREIGTEEKKALEEMDPDALESLVNFAYSGRVKISSENAQLLLSASKILHLSQVFNFCCEFLVKQLHVNNAWEMRKFAENLSCAKLMYDIDQYILKHFEAFSKLESFSALPSSYLKKIISRDEVRVSSEEVVFESVIRWVNVSTERIDDLRELLCCVRMTQITPGYLVERVSNEQLVQTVALCKDLVEEAKLYHLVPEKMSENCSFPLRPRIYQGKSQINATENAETRGVYAVCEFKSGLSVKFLDNENWVNVSSTAIKGIDKVVAFGGVIWAFSDTRIELFNVKTLKWSLLNTVHENLKMSGVVVHNKKIYFFGGPETGSNIVRCFFPKWNEWLAEDKMTRRIDFPGVASSSKYIYVTGGSFERIVHKSAERYDPKKKEWLSISPMLSERFCHGCTSLNGKIYVCGGSDDEKYLDTAEVYDPFTNQWTSIASMKAPRNAFSIVSHNDRIYALGGLTKNFKCAVDVEIYDSDENEWKSDVFPCDEKICDIFLVRAMIPTTSSNKGAGSKVLPPFKDRADDFTYSCNNCGKKGHLSKYCRNKVATKLTKNNSKCYRCAKTGHFMQDCPLLESSDKLCHSCGHLGHFARDCPSAESDDKMCYSCGRFGHFARDCFSSSRDAKKYHHSGMSGDHAGNSSKRMSSYYWEKPNHDAHISPPPGNDSENDRCGDIDQVPSD